jgi:predicted RNA-binding Zn-ribbon protein involved in translation (DUF1610 family)
MQCQGCGGAVDYQPGVGLFKCKFCGSVYESDSSDGGGTVRAIKVIEKKLDTIEKHTGETAGMMGEQRLQKKASDIQDKIDFKYIEFENGSARKLGSAAVVVWIIGGIVILVGLCNLWKGLIAVLIGGVLIAVGVGLFGKFKKTKQEFVDTVNQITQNELDAVHEQLKKLGSVLPGGQVSVGYTESTSVPMRYCVACHKNVTPAKEEGKGFAGMSGMNMTLTFLTCGLWLPAWIMIEVMSRAGGVASRAMRKGKCPQCGNEILFPARIPNA